MALSINSRVAWQLVGDEAIVIDLGEGRVVGLNPAASLIWSLLPDNDEEAIAVALTQRFETDLKTAREDVRQFVDQLRQRGLLAEA